MCDHANAIPTFDYVIARKLPRDEVAERYPPLTVCPDCGHEALYYASFQHFLLADDRATGLGINIPIQG